MPITINGTTVTTNSVNGTSVSSETVNGTQVYSGTVSRVWYYFTNQSSRPSTDYAPYTMISGQGVEPTRAEVEDSMTSSFPPANIPVGTIGMIDYTNLGLYYLLMIIEE